MAKMTSGPLNCDPYSRFAPPILFALIAAGPVRAQSPDARPAVANRAAASCDSLLRRERLPALGVAVFSRGILVVDTAFGLSSIDDSTKATPRTLFRLGSISKTITAAAVLRAADDRVISLDADIRTYVPAFPAKQHSVTLRQLLTGTAGIRGYAGEEYRRNDHFSSLASTLAIFGSDSLAFIPGTSYLETPYGFSLLGLAIEARAHAPYAEYVRDVVLRPSGMSRTAIEDRSTPSGDRAVPYTRDSSGQVRRADPIDVSSKVPAGGWLATAGDVAKFGGAIIRRRLFSLEAYTSMTSPTRIGNGVALPIGMAIALGTAGGRLPGDETSIWSSGIIQGGTAVLLMDPRHDLAVAVLTNVNADGGTNGLRLLTELSNLAITLAGRYR